MSCYEWERGEITLPAKVYPKFRQNVIKAWNDWQLELLEKAKIAVELLRKAPSKPDLVTQFLFEDWRFRNLQDFELAAIVNLIPYKDGKWFVPKKQDLNLYPISKGTTLYLDEASITLVDEQHGVIWNVSNNNHACERAHNHSVANKMFRLLAEVEWTRGTGGEIVGNNEYNQDNDYSGGGANFIKQTYGP